MLKIGVGTSAAASMAPATPLNLSQIMGLDPDWEIRSVTQGRVDVTASGIGLTGDTEAKVVIVVGRR
jgi:hypothetical protein